MSDREQMIAEIKQALENESDIHYSSKIRRLGPEWLQFLLTERNEQPGSEHVRKEVQWFAQQMEERLKANDHKGGWDRETIEWLKERLFQNYRDLETSILNIRAWQENGDLTDREINRLIGDCADIANRAMMIADVSRKLI
ncbi:hypothetical protein [Paenibacillus sp. 32O-W]|uniref:hypothetical protein n=1 Tax=Paenibacillus sp. 32O-W TaxID=1695218 RepID=UPI0011A59C68|nr:hypothetical protein [Paenibacillus sp. 32O-W]